MTRKANPASASWRECTVGWTVEPFGHASRMSTLCAGKTILNCAALPSARCRERGAWIPDQRQLDLRLLAQQSAEP